MTASTIIILCYLTVLAAAWGSIRAPLVDRITELRRQTNHARDVRCLAPLRRVYVPAFRVPLSNRPANIVKERNRLGRARAAERACVPWYITKQIWAGNILGRESAGDPWPNCPDPYDGGGYSWYDTVGCENGGNWLDSPGFYRCGLQFHPNWEIRFGRLCP